MATIYVDADAGAGGDGSLGSPYDAMSDVNGASGNVSSGDTVYLQGAFAPAATWSPEAGAEYYQWPGETNWTVDASGVGASNDGIVIGVSVEMSGFDIDGAPSENIYIVGITGTEVVTLCDVNESNAGEHGIYNLSQSGGTVNLTNCTSTNAGGRGISSNNQSGGAVNIINCTVTNAGTFNIFNSNQSDGVWVCQDCLSDLSGSIGIKLSSCSGGSQRIERCVSMRSLETTGIEFDTVTSSDTVARNCLVYKSNYLNTGVAGLFEIVVQDSSTDVLVYNFTTTGGEHSGYGIGLWDSCTNCVIKNCLSANHSNAEFYCDAGSSATATFDYNHVHHPSSRFGLWDGTACAALSNWQSTSSQGANSSEGDPLFADEPNDDYHLTQNSPCFQAGAEGLGVNYDLDGNKRDAPPDIGAYEYQRTGGRTPALRIRTVAPWLRWRRGVRGRR
jgi:hypothetical protein